MNTQPDTCLNCNSTDARKVVRDRTINADAYSITIPYASHIECSSCGESYQTGQQAKVLDAQVVDARRRHESILSGSDFERSTCTNLSKAEAPR